MKLSTDRILTTHVGSLPRSKAVAAIVARQVATGIDVVSDGETSKIGYATYIKDRLTGFGGENFTPKPNRDVADYPEFRQRMLLFTGPQVFRRLCCTGDITIKDHDSVKHDIANFKAAIAAAKPTDAFMPAASPGVVSAFQPNRHYPSHTAYINAVA